MRICLLDLKVSYSQNGNNHTVRKPTTHNKMFETQRETRPL